MGFIKLYFVHLLLVFYSKQHRLTALSVLFVVDFRRSPEIADGRTAFLLNEFKDPDIFHSVVSPLPYQEPFLFCKAFLLLITK